jgi:D-aminopeptidase
MKFYIIICIAALFLITDLYSQQKRVRDYGIEVGVLKPGKNNAITRCI